jgi:hypothetical protein
MIFSATLLNLDIGKQDDLRYWWRLSRLSGRVTEQGVEAYIADCLTAAANTVDPASRIVVTVDGVPGGFYDAVRMQLEPVDVAADVAKTVLVQQAGKPTSAAP